MRYDNEKFRVDDGYFAKLPVLTQKRIEALPHVRLGEVCSVFRKGIFDIKASSYSSSGVPFVRIGNLRGGLIDRRDLAFITPEAHAAESKTALEFGDLVLSKTAYAAASFVNLPQCNVSQDTIAVRLSSTGRRRLRSGFIAAYLNSRYGLALMQRHFQGNVQAHLALPDGRKVPVPLSTRAFQDAIDESIRDAHNEVVHAERLLHDATTILTEALALDGWRPDEPLTYIRRASEVFAAKRVDAEYFHPAKRGFRDRLRSLPGAPLEVHYRAVRDMFDPRLTNPGDVVRNYDLTDALDGVLDDTHPLMLGREVGSAKKRFIAGDVVISRLRAYLGEVALVRASDAVPSVGSSEFIVLRPKDAERPRLSRAALLVFLRSTPVQTILKWSQDGSHHPRFGDEDLMSIFVPDAVCSVGPRIEDLFGRVLVARARGRALLASAKRAVDIAIEGNEADGLSFLSAATQA